MLVAGLLVLLTVAFRGTNAALCAACTKAGSDCAALQTYISCLDAASDAPCTLSTGQISAVSGDTTCDAGALVACKCQIDVYSTQFTTDDIKCTTLKTGLACLSIAKDSSCDSTVQTKTVADKYETARAALSVTATCTAPTTTCACQITAARADTSTDPLFCSAMADLSNCFFGIATASELTCTSAIKSAARTDLIAVESAAPCSLKTCAVCKTDYATAKTSAGSNDAAKCTAIQTYIKCLEMASDKPHLCLSQTDSAAIVTDYTAASCTFTGSCMCQKVLWSTDISANNAAQCTALKTSLSCLLDTTDYVGCSSQTKSSAAMYHAQALTGLNSISSSDCAALTATCTCVQSAVTSGVTDKTTYCAALKTLGTCLAAVTDAAQVGCKSGDTKATMATKQATLYATALCSADHVTFVLTSILACLFVTFSL